MHVGLRQDTGEVLRCYYNTYKYRQGTLFMDLRLGYFSLKSGRNRTNASTSHHICRCFHSSSPLAPAFQTSNNMALAVAFELHHQLLDALVWSICYPLAFLSQEGESKAAISTNQCLQEAKPRLVSAQKSSA